MNNFNLRVCAIFLAAAPILSISGANAAVMTSGCASATSCTIAELAGGGSITIDDVTFSNFSVTNDNGNIALDTSNLSISGVTDGSSVTLDYAFATPISIDSTSATFLDTTINFDVAVSGGSTRTLTSVSAAFDTGDSSFTGVGGTQIDVIDGGGGGFSTFIIENSDLLVKLSESAGLSNLTALSIATNIDAGLQVAITGSTFLAGFLQSFSLDGQFTPPNGEVPIPAALPFMLTGLAGLGWARRRKNRAA